MENLTPTTGVPNDLIDLPIDSPEEPQQNAGQVQPPSDLQDLPNDFKGLFGKLSSEFQTQFKRPFRVTTQPGAPGYKNLHKNLHNSNAADIGGNDLSDDEASWLVNRGGQYGLNVKDYRKNWREIGGTAPHIHIDDDFGGIQYVQPPAQTQVQTQQVNPTQLPNDLVDLPLEETPQPISLKPPSTIHPTQQMQAQSKFKKLLPTLNSAAQAIGEFEYLKEQAARQKAESKGYLDIQWYTTLQAAQKKAVEIQQKYDKHVEVGNLTEWPYIKPKGWQITKSGRPASEFSANLSHEQPELTLEEFKHQVGDKQIEAGLAASAHIPSGFNLQDAERQREESDRYQAVSQYWHDKHKEEQAAIGAKQDDGNLGVDNTIRHAVVNALTGLGETTWNVGLKGLEISPIGQLINQLRPQTHDEVKHFLNSINQAASDLRDQNQGDKFFNNLLYQTGALAPKMIAPGGVIGFGATQALDALGHNASPLEALKEGLIAVGTARLAHVLGIAATRIPSATLSHTIPNAIESFGKQWLANSTAPALVHFLTTGETPDKNQAAYDLAFGALFTMYGARVQDLDPNKPLTEFEPVLSEMKQHLMESGKMTPEDADQYVRVAYANAVVKARNQGVDPVTIAKNIREGAKQYWVNKFEWLKKYNKEAPKELGTNPETEFESGLKEAVRQAKAQGIEVTPEYIASKFGLDLAKADAIINEVSPVEAKPVETTKASVVEEPSNGITPEEHTSLRDALYSDEEIAAMSPDQARQKIAGFQELYPNQQQTIQPESKSQLPGVVYRNDNGAALEVLDQVGEAYRVQNEKGRTYLIHRNATFIPEQLTSEGKGQIVLNKQTNQPLTVLATRGEAFIVKNEAGKIYTLHKNATIAAPPEILSKEQQTIPETPHTITAQMNALAEGRKGAVLITPNEQIPVLPDHMVATSTPVGTFIHSPSISPRDVIEAVATDNYHGLLGFVAPKPDQGEPSVTVVARDSSGRELQSAVVPPEYADLQDHEFRQIYPHATVVMGGDDVSKAVVQHRVESQPDWLKQNLDVLTSGAEKSGLADQVEDLSAQRLTAKEVAQKLNTDVDIVRAIRAKRGVPSMDDTTEFENWLSKRSAVPLQVEQRGLTTTETAEANKARVPEGMVAVGPEEFGITAENGPLPADQRYGTKTEIPAQEMIEQGFPALDTSRMISPESKVRDIESGTFDTDRMHVSIDYKDGRAFVVANLKDAHKSLYDNGGVAVEATIDYNPAERKVYLNRIDSYKRGKGLAGEILNSVLNDAASRGYKTASSYIENINADSRSMMRRLGATEGKQTEAGQYWNIDLQNRNLSKVESSPTPQEIGLALRSKLREKHGTDLPVSDLITETPSFHVEMKKSGLDAQGQLEAFRTMGFDFKDPVQMIGTIRATQSELGRIQRLDIQYKSGGRNIPYRVLGRFPGGEKIMVMTPDSDIKIIQSPLGQTGNTRVKGVVPKEIFGKIPAIRWQEIGMDGDAWPTKADIHRVNPAIDDVLDLTDDELQEYFPEVWRRVQEAQEQLGNAAGKEFLSRVYDEGNGDDNDLVQESRDHLNQLFNANIRSDNTSQWLYDTGVVVGNDLLKLYPEQDIWKERLTEKLGESIKPHLDNIWDAINGYAPMFFSPLERALKTEIPNKAQAAQIKGILRKAGVSDDEMKWTGFDEFLKIKAMKEELVNRQDALEFFQKNQVLLTERTFSDEEHKPVQWKSGKDWWIGTVTDGRQYKIEKLYPNGRYKLIFPGNLIELKDSLGEAKSVVEDLNEPVDKTKFKSHTTLGGTNHREITLSLPIFKSDRIAEIDQRMQNLLYPANLKSSEYAIEQWYKDHPESERERKSLLRERESLIYQREQQKYKPPSAHQYGVPEADINRIAIIRVNDRVGSNNERILHVDEFQDDLQNEIQKLKNSIKRTQDQIKNTDWSKNSTQFFNEAALETTIKSETSKLDRLQSLLPFRGKSHELAMKYALGYAINHGYDMLTWSTGRQVADRYSLSKHMDSLRWQQRQSGDGGYFIYGYKNNQEILRQDVPKDKLAETIGKDLAERIINNPATTGEFSNLDLQVGGEGKLSLYDKIIPDFMRKYTKKWNGEIGNTNIRTAGWQVRNIETNQTYRGYSSEESANEFLQHGINANVDVSKYITEPISENVHALPVNSSMRDSILRSGQSLFGTSEGQPSEVTESLSRLRDQQARKRRNPSLGELLSIRRSDEEQNEKFVKTAISMFGTTNDIKDAGYILSNGVMLDFEASSGDPEHYRLGDIISRQRMNEALKKEDGSEGKIAYEAQNALNTLRLSYSGHDNTHLGISTAMTLISAPQIGRILSIVDGLKSLAIEIIDENGKTKFRDIIQAPNRIDVARSIRNINDLISKETGTELESKRSVTDTPEFKKWFKDSKVVDKKGEPLVVYHGTLTNFDVFDRDKLNIYGKWGEQSGFFFTPSQWIAGKYAARFRETDLGANVVPVYLSMQNPLKIDFVRDTHSDARELNETLLSVQDKGYDGVIINNYNDVFDPQGENEQLIVFSPEQIKSATGNRGTFDPNNPSILESIRNSSPEAGQMIDTAEIGLGKQMTGEAINRASRSGRTIHTLGKAGDALIDYRSKSNRLYLNGVGEEVLRMIRTNAYGSEVSNAYGVTFDTNKLNELIDGAKEIQKPLQNPEAIGVLDDFIKAFQSSVKRNEPLTIIDYSNTTGPGTRKTAKHEEVHRVDLMIRDAFNNIVPDIEEMRQLPHMDQLTRRISGKLGYKTDPRIVAMEAIARISTGDNEELELTPDEEVEFLDGYYTLMADTYHEDVLDQYKLITDAARKVKDEVKTKFKSFSEGIESTTSTPSSMEGGRQGETERGVGEGQKITDSPAFQRWQGKSKIVNSDYTFKTGDPVTIKAFHGTHKDFVEFQLTPRNGEAAQAGNGRALFFSNDPEVANSFAFTSAQWEDSQYNLNHSLGQQVLPSYIKFENPLVTDGFTNPEALDSLLDRAFKLGHDGIIITRAMEQYLPADAKDVEEELDFKDSTIYAVFHPTQIKSIFNRGTFNPQSANILEHKINNSYDYLDDKISNGTLGVKSVEDTYHISLVTGYDILKSDPTVNRDAWKEAVLRQLGERSRPHLDAVWDLVSGKAPTFYSPMLNLITSKVPNKASVEQVRGILKGLSEDELKWSGINDLLKEKAAARESITKQELLDHLEVNNISVKTITSGNTIKPLEWQNIEHVNPEKPSRQEAIDSAGYKYIIEPREIDEDTSQRNYSVIIKDSFGNEKLATFGGSLEAAHGLAESLRWDKKSPEEIVKPDIDLLRQEGFDIEADDYNVVSFLELDAEGETTGKIFDVEDLPDYIHSAANRIVLAFGQKEGDTRYSEYKLEGGNNYVEIKLTLPVKDRRLKELPLNYTVEKPRKGGQGFTVYDPQGRDYGYGETEEAAREDALRIINSMRMDNPHEGAYTSPHYDEPDMLAHIRGDEREHTDGIEGFVIDEAQSDWATEGRKKGFIKNGVSQESANNALLKYQDELRSFYEPIYGESLNYEQLTDVIGPEEKEKLEELEQVLETALSTKILQGVPDMPFFKQWPLLVTKQAIRHAVEQGLSRVSIVGARVHIDRWGTERAVWRRGNSNDLDQRNERLNNEKISIAERITILEDIEKLNNEAWLFQFKAQEGGQAGGINLEQEGLARGLIKEDVLNPVHIIRNKEDIVKIVKKFGGGQNAEALTDKLWNRMQKEDEGTSWPRAEGQLAHYGDTAEYIQSRFPNRPDLLKFAWDRGDGKQSEAFMPIAFRDVGKAWKADVSIKELIEGSFIIRSSDAGNKRFAVLAPLGRSENIFQTFDTREEAESYAKTNVMHGRVIDTENYDPTKIQSYSLDIPPSMSNAVIRTGQPLYGSLVDDPVYVLDAKQRMSPQGRKNIIDQGIITGHQILSKEEFSLIKREWNGNYLYHGTSEGAFRRIREQGLIGDKIHFADKESYAKTYATRKGDSFGERILRVKQTDDFKVDDRIRHGGDYISENSILPNDIEIKVSDKWIPIQDYHDESINIMPIRNTTQFASWSKEMLHQLGESIRPHLDSIWSRLQEAKEIESKGVELESKSPESDDETRKRLSELFDELVPPTPEPNTGTGKKDLPTPRKNYRPNDDYFEPEEGYEIVHPTFKETLRSSHLLTPWRAPLHAFRELMNFQRAWITGPDLSGTLRQNLIPSIAMPSVGPRAFAKQLQAFVMNREKFEASMKELHSQPDFALTEQMGIEYTNAANRREELFRSPLADFVPWIRMSDQAMTAELNWSRYWAASLFAKQLKEGVSYIPFIGQWLPIGRLQGIDIEKDPASYYAAGRFVNAITGRGDMHDISEAMNDLLNTGLFSARMQKARYDLLNPFNYIKMPRQARVIALRKMFEFSSLIMGILTLAALAGFKVTKDPDDPDFGKIVIGHTHYDLTAGYAAYLRMYILSARNLYRGQYKKTVEQWAHFFRGKLAPFPAAAVNLYQGKDFVNRPTDVPTEAARLFTPMFVDNLREAYKDSGITGAMKASTEILGLGASTYPPVTKEKHTVMEDKLIDRNRRRYNDDPISTDDKARIDAEKQIVDVLKKGDNEQAGKLFTEAMNKGLLARNDEDRITKKAKMSYLEYNVNNMPLEAGLDIFLDKDCTKEERIDLAPILAKKYELYMKQRTDESKENKGTVAKYVFDRTMKKLEEAKKLGIIEMAQEKAKAATIH